MTPFRQRVEWPSPARRGTAGLGSALLGKAPHGKDTLSISSPHRRGTAALCPAKPGLARQRKAAQGKDTLSTFQSDAGRRRAQPSRARPGLAKPGKDRQRAATQRTAEPGGAEPGRATLKRGKARFSLSIFASGHCRAGHGGARHRLAGRGKGLFNQFYSSLGNAAPSGAGLSAARDGTARLCSSRLGGARHSNGLFIDFDAALSGSAEQRPAGRGEARRSGAKQGFIQRKDRARPRVALLGDAPRSLALPGAA